MRRADRLIQIVHYLRRRRQAVTARKIAEDFGICQRTVYRDIQDLMNTGVPIAGAAGVGYVIDKQYHLPPVMFDVDELEALALGVSMVSSWTDARFAGKANSALEKIQAVLPAQRLREMEQLTTHAEISRAKVPWSVDFSEIRECIRQRRRIRFDYVDLQHRHSHRTVRPLSLVFFGPVWLVVGWCEQRRDFRSFRLDRMQNLSIGEDTFADESDKSLRAYLARMA